MCPTPATADEEGIRRHSSAMNAGDAVPLFVGMLTQRPWEQVTQKGKVRHTRQGVSCWPGRVWPWEGVTQAGKASGQ